MIYTHAYSGRIDPNIASSYFISPTAASIFGDLPADSVSPKEMLLFFGMDLAKHWGPAPHKRKN